MQRIRREQDTKFNVYLGHKESIVSVLLYGAPERFNPYLLLTAWELCEIPGAASAH